MMRQTFLATLLSLGAVEVVAQTDTPRWLPASAEKLPLWRGFNLTNKFHLKGRNGPFEEKDFRLISELGFNFVRLPMDYRVWIVDGDWRRFDEEVLSEIDQAVDWGGQYGIHVCINFHRAPGYTVANPKEATDLWTDPETQEVCALHWATFAERYRDIPNERLSFNLFNEPAHIEGKTYARVAEQMVNAIREQDPDRLIIADGVEWGKRPCEELYPLKIAQATRGYAPGYVSHYKASWAGSWEGVPEPVWPRPMAVGWLAGDTKADLRKPLLIEGPFPDSVRLRIRVGVVSTKAHLTIQADGATIFEEVFVPGPGQGPWKKAEFKPQWNIYQNLYDRDYHMTVPAETRQVSMRVGEGDWMTISEIGVEPETGQERVLTMVTDYGKQPEPIQYRHDHPERPFLTQTMHNREWLWDTYIVPWQEAQQVGVGVVVGEFGAFKHTPHDVVLAWMEDCLQNWQRAGWGWAMWNFRGGFGILDSGRDDVDYEDFHGHKLDRRMLDLLLKYK